MQLITSSPGCRMSGLTSANSIVRFGVFELDLRAGELHKSGVLLHLPPQPFKVLALLVSRPAQLVTREEIRGEIWGTDTFVDFEHGLNFAIKKIRDTLGDDPETPRYIETLPRRGYRFVAPVEGVAVHPSVPSKTEETSSEKPQASSHRVWRWAAVALVVFVLGLATAAYFYLHRAPVLSAKDFVVVADFINTTGDPVFDGALRQGLSVQLEQTPYLRLVSGDQIAETLRLMEQPPDTRLTHDVAREVCQRANATVLIEGSIAALGSQYVLGLNAVNCGTGEALAAEQVTADGKEKILAALGSAASGLRSKLGESRTSLAAHDVPLDRATTTSLEALQSWALGVNAVRNGNCQSGISFFQRAVSLDPNFAEAYSFLGGCYSGLGQQDLAAKYAAKAYDLRDRVSEREKFFIVWTYHLYSTGDMEKAVEIAEQWANLYPRDASAYLALSGSLSFAGRYEESLAAALEYLRLDPMLAYLFVPSRYVLLGRLEEARATIQQAERNHVDPALFRSLLYQIAFLKGDSAGMAEQLAGPWVFADAVDSWTAAYHGRLTHARELRDRAIASARHRGASGLAANYDVGGAVYEALFGNFPEARKLVKDAGDLSTGHHDLEGAAAVVYALAGDTVQAQELAGDLNKRFPDATYLQFGALPALRGIVALHRGEPNEATKALDAISSYELVPP